MRIFIAGLDCGHYTNFAYHYIDTCPFTVVGLKGKDVSRFIKIGADLPKFKRARERSNLYLVEVGEIKDDVAQLMKLNWDGSDMQPPGFMNFPESANGLYGYKSFFSHYESEHRVIESKDGKSISAMWKKKSSLSQNHMWDCKIYNFAVKEIFIWMIAKQLKVQEYTWQDFVNTALQK